MRFILYSLLFFAFFDMFSQFPIMSPYIVSLEGSMFIASLAVGMYSFANMFGNVGVGILLSRNHIRIRSIFAIALLCSGIFLLGYTVVTNAFALFIVRFFHGFASGFIVPAIYTYLSTNVSENEQGKEFAKSGGAIGLAAIVGPAFGGIVAANSNVEIVFTITGSLLIIASILAILFVPELRTQTSESSRNSSDFFSYKKLFRNPAILTSLLSAFSLLFTLGILTYSLPLKVIALGYDDRVSGMLMSTFGIVAVLIFILPINRMYDTKSPLLFMGCGQVLIASILLIIHYTSSLNVLYVCMGIFGVGYAFIFPSSNKWVIQHTSSRERGAAFALYYACFSIGVVCGSFLAGMFTNSMVPFLFSTLLLLFATIFIRFSRKQYI